MKLFKFCKLWNHNLRNTSHNKMLFHAKITPRFVRTGEQSFHLNTWELQRHSQLNNAKRKNKSWQSLWETLHVINPNFDREDTTHRATECFKINYFVTLITHSSERLVSLAKRSSLDCYTWIIGSIINYWKNTSA